MGNVYEVSIQQIEYCLCKISTIWDIAYEIANILFFLKNKKLMKRM